MANRVHAFKDRDVQRIIRSVQRSTGRAAARVEVDPNSGKVTVHVGGDAVVDEPNPWLDDKEHSS